jgi:hypothetical protein
VSHGREVRRCGEFSKRRPPLPPSSYPSLPLGNLWRWGARAPNAAQRRPPERSPAAIGQHFRRRGSPVAAGARPSHCLTLCRHLLSHPTPFSSALQTMQAAQRAALGSRPRASRPGGQPGCGPRRPPLPVRCSRAGMLAGVCKSAAAVALAFLSFLWNPGLAPPPPHTHTHTFNHTRLLSPPPPPPPSPPAEYIPRLRQFLVQCWGEDFRQHLRSAGIAV